MIEQLTTLYPKLLSITLPLFFVLSLSILYSGHLLIAFLLKYIANPKQLLISPKTSNDYVEVDDHLHDVGSRNSTIRNPLTVLLKTHAVIVHNALSTRYTSYPTNNIIGTVSVQIL